jgi:hypothetical protein
MVVTARRLACACAAIACVALQSLNAAPDWTVYLRRAGVIRIGASLDEARRVLGDRRAALKSNTPRSPIDECAYLTSSTLPNGLSVMFQHGRAVRIDVRSAAIKTASGVGLGTSEDDVRRAYVARIETTLRKYAVGHYLTYTAADDSDRGLGMVFETDGAYVTSFRIGTTEAVALVEGCS